MPYTFTAFVDIEIDDWENLSPTDLMKAAGDVLRRGEFTLGAVMDTRSAKKLFFQNLKGLDVTDTDEDATFYFNQIPDEP
jgi:hypothetical protein